MLGPNGEKSEIWVTANDTMHRFPENQAFKPGDLIEAVRNYDFETIDNAMDYIVDSQKAALAPWFGQSTFSRPVTMGNS